MVKKSFICTEAAWQVELLFKHFKRNFFHYHHFKRQEVKKYAETRSPFMAGNMGNDTGGSNSWQNVSLLEKKKTVLFMKNAKFIFADKKKFYVCHEDSLLILQIKKVFTLPVKKKAMPEETSMMSSMQQFYQDCLLRFALMGIILLVTYYTV